MSDFLTAVFQYLDLPLFASRSTNRNYVRSARRINKAKFKTLSVGPFGQSSVCTSPLIYFEQYIKEDPLCLHSLRRDPSSYCTVLVMSLIQVIVLTLVLVVVWYAWKIGSREPGLPPGPPTLPLIGNVHQFPKEFMPHRYTAYLPVYVVYI